MCPEESNQNGEASIKHILENCQRNLETSPGKKISKAIYMKSFKIFQVSSL